MKFNNKYIIGFICCAIFLISYLMLAFYIGFSAEHDTRKKADVILVLGARSFIGQQYNPCLKARVDHAVELYKANYAPKILMTGGNDTEDNINEAETMKKIVVEKGIPAQDILLEKNATSTFENFRLSLPILSKHNLKSTIVVTEPFHIARAALIAEKLHYDYTVSPAAKSSCWLPNKYLSKYFLKEPFAIALYKLQNKL